MADNVAITAGSGTNIATDDCGAGGHAQIFKEAISTDGSATLIGSNASGKFVQGPIAHDGVAAGNPLLVGAYARDDGDPSAVSATGDVVQLVADLKGRQLVRPVPYTIRIAANISGTLTTSVTAYTAGDTLGAITALAGAARISGGTGVIRSVTVLDKSDITGVLDVAFFRSSITLASDNAAFAISDTDAEAWVGTVNVNMVDYGNNRMGVASPYLAFDCSGSTSLYAAFITRTGHTFFGGANDIRIAVVIQQD